MEIYNETLRDLLVDPNSDEEVAEIKIQHDKNNFIVTGLKERIVTSKEETLAVLREGNGTFLIAYSQFCFNIAHLTNPN